jgi:hypothetical protein
MMYGVWQIDGDNLEIVSLSRWIENATIYRFKQILRLS